jgi:tRNA A-37 threonylcarbamoyl transferase component Bud32
VSASASRGWLDGPWRLRGDPALFALARPGLEHDARPGLEHDARRGAKVSESRALGGLRVFHKASPLALRPALRHATRAALGLAEVPRLQELANLEWLRAHGFSAVRPVLAGVRSSARLPRYQFLLTELVEGARTLAELFDAGPSARREAALRALAHALARLHALGFVHRDLFPRNLLVRAEGGEIRCTFLDTWRGTPRRGRRAPEHDLGCLLLDGASSLSPAEQRLVLAVYREQSERAGRRLPPDWARRVERARAAVRARESRRRLDVAANWHFPT